MGQIVADRKRKSDWDWFKRDKRLYDCWLGMRKRIRMNDQPKYVWYKGLTICDEWGDYWSFHEWAMANGYADNLTLDRIDNTKGYSPDNCRWLTMRDQQRNKRNNHLITAFGETKTAIEWFEDERCVVAESTLYARMYKGWKPEDALTTKAAGPNPPVQSKLSEADVRRIRSLKGIVPQRKLAAEYGVSNGNIAAIHSGRSWGHLLD